VGELNREPSRQCVTDALEMMLRYLSECNCVNATSHCVLDFSLQKAEYLTRGLFVQNVTPRCMWL
jgi:hypothetical protein